MSSFRYPELEITRQLNRVANTHAVEILYAAESGSRAWGFASIDSDYDVRFIYAHPIEHYLSFNVERHRDVIEPETDDTSDLDVRGWDIRKALGLFTRSNGALLEWLRSPIRYQHAHPSILKLESLAKHAFDPTALMYHYYRMAKNNAREFLRRDAVSLKKYLYVLRGLIAVDFIRCIEQLPPVNFMSLLEETAGFNANVSAIRGSVEALIVEKRKRRELGTGDRIEELDAYIQGATHINENEFESFKRDDLRQSVWDPELNEIFRDALDADARHR